MLYYNYRDLVKGLGLSFISSEIRQVKGASTKMEGSKIKGVVAFNMEIEGFSQTVYAYVVPGLAFPLILGNPWKAHNQVRTAPEKRRYYYGRADKWIKEGKNYEERPDSGSFISLAAATVEDIRKALKIKGYLTEEELKQRLLPEV